MYTNEDNLCPLCSNSSTVFYQYKKRLYHQCKICKGIFVDHNLLPNKETERTRYLEHNNDVNDKKFQHFVSPITSSILKNHTAHNSGLDFGAGTGPVISKVLSDNNFSVALYDPFFHNSPELLKKKYDYIVCCEVIEHFHNPKKEFMLLKKLLNENGKLYCMTDIYNENINFHTWYYKNDLTHVFIYLQETIDWIKKEMNFSEMFIKDRLIILSL